MRTSFYFDLLNFILKVLKYYTYIKLISLRYAFNLQLWRLRWKLVLFLIRFPMSFSIVMLVDPQISHFLRTYEAISELVGRRNANLWRTCTWPVGDGFSCQTFSWAILYCFIFFCLFINCFQHVLRLSVWVVGKVQNFGCISALWPHCKGFWGYRNKIGAINAELFKLTARDNNFAAVTALNIFHP